MMLVAAGFHGKVEEVVYGLFSTHLMGEVVNALAHFIAFLLDLNDALFAAGLV